MDRPADLEGPGNRSGPARPDARMSGWRYTFSSLAEPSFRLLWLAMLFRGAALGMEQIARGFLVYEITGSAKVLGLVSAAAVVPVLALALLSGAVADRLDRKHLIQAAQATSVASSLFVAGSITSGTLTWPHLLLAGMVSGGAASFMVPARQAMIPQLVPKARLGNAVALVSMGMSVTSLAAPAAGGLLYAAIGPEMVFYVISAIGVSAVVLTGLIPRIAKPAKRAAVPMLFEIKEGLQVVWHDRTVLSLLALGLATGLLSSPFHQLLPVFVVDVYHRESEAFGLLVSVMGLGVVSGSLAVAMLGEGRRGLFTIVGSIAGGAVMVTVALFPSYVVAAGVMLLFGLGLGGREVLYQVLVLERVDDRYRGRIMSILVFSYGLMPLAVLPAGVAVDLVGIRPTVGVLGVGLVVMATLVLAGQKSLRSLR